MNAQAPKSPDPAGGTPAPQQPAASQPAPNPPPSNAPAPGATGATGATGGATGATGAAPGATGSTGATGAKPTSIYEAAGVDEPGKPGSTTWPENWREQAAQAAEDPKAAAKVLERYATPAEMAKALLAAQQKIRSGEYKRAAPPGDNPEELKAWRDEQGIPESPDGYEVPGVDLEKIEPHAKAAIDHVRAKLHAENFDKGKAATVATLLQEVAAMEMERVALADATNMDAIEDTLRAEWGADYRRNINLNGALLTQHFGDQMDSILNARTPGGMRLADMPEFNRFLNTMARATGPDVLFEGEPGGGKSIDARLEEIRTVMRTNINEYHAKGLDKEYAQLLEKQEARARR